MSNKARLVSNHGFRGSCGRKMRNISEKSSTACARNFGGGGGSRVNGRAPERRCVDSRKMIRVNGEKTAIEDTGYAATNLDRCRFS